MEVCGLKLPPRLISAVQCAGLLFCLVGLRAHRPVEQKLAEAEAWVRAEPLSAAARFERGELLRVSRRCERARTDYRAALRLDPEFNAARLGWAACELESGQPAAALLQLARFLRLQPGHPEGLRLKARALARSSRPQEAAAAYEELLAVFNDAHPGEPEDYLEASRALRRAGRPAEAEIAVIDLGIARCGPAITLELAALAREEESGRFKAALARLDAIIARDPRPVRWAARRASLLRRIGYNEDGSTR